MRYLILVPLFFMSIAVKAANDPMCRDVKASVENILNKPGSGVTEAYAVVHPRVRARDVNNVSETPNILQDASYLQVGGGRALKSSDPQVVAKAHEAIDGKIAELTAAAQSPANQNYSTSLLRAKDQLLELKYLNGKDIKSLSIDELKNMQAQLKVGLPSYGKPEAHLMPEKDLLAKIEKELNSRPEVVADHQRRLAQAGQEYRAGLSSQEIAARTANPNVAARPLTTDQSNELQRFSEILRRDPASLTPEQVKRMETLRSEVEAKRNWKDGQYSGMISEDQNSATGFMAAWDSAAVAMRRRAESMESLAAQQGRVLKPPTTQVNRQDFWGNRSRQTVVSARGAAVATPEAEKIMRDLNRVSPGYARIEQVVAYKPVVTRVEDMNRVSSALAAVNITRDEVSAVNVISTLDVTNLDFAAGAFGQAKQFLEKMETAQKNGQLSAASKQMNADDVRVIRQMIETAKFHVNHYVPPHLQLERYNSGNP